jgi:hypothetical protein
MTKLKLCPFCNHKAKQSVVNLNYRTGCANCEIHLMSKTQEEGVNSWNSRVYEYQIESLTDIINMVGVAMAETHVKIKSMIDALQTKLTENKNESTATYV